MNDGDYVSRSPTCLREETVAQAAGSLSDAAEPSSGWKSATMLLIYADVSRRQGAEVRMARSAVRTPLVSLVRPQEGRAVHVL